MNRRAVAPTVRTTPGHARGRRQVRALWRAAGAGAAGVAGVLLVAACATAANVSQPAQPASSRAIGSLAGTPARPGHTGFEPDGVAFWNADNGLLVGTVTTPQCLAGSAACPGGLIERTTDGGRRWQVVDKVSVPLDAVAVAGRSAAWVTTGRCGAANPDACGSRLFLVTANGGRNWTRVHSRIAVTSLSPLSAAAAWAVRSESDTASPRGAGLVQTTDGGRSWRRAADPCLRGPGGPAWAVDFATAVQGWAMCVSQPATDMQPKAVYATTDGGRSWQLKSRTCAFGPNGQQAAQVGALACVGYLPGFQLLAGGHGWEWTSRGGLATTSDGGSTWATLAARIVTGDSNSVVSAALVSDTVGFLLISQPETQSGCPRHGCGPRLLSTTDGGRAWITVASWPPPSR